ncbi:MAG: 3,4-dihydroxy-2-butanone 4-phosphate synthase/GTP cyclohydrolase II [uncultured bacterium]|nr:MAG: 3,4-dihydroxy-2-butanone 4-phosphate synthase/GTP cyclohydrolase II [uncultured bacterium]
MFNIGSKITEKLLNYYFSAPDANHYINELARLLDVDPGNLDRKIKELEKEGIFISQINGNQKYFSLNKKYPLIVELEQFHALKYGADKNETQKIKQTKSNFKVHASILNLKNKFTETKIATKFGDFNIRVYADSQGKETVVLYTEKIDSSAPVLVRIHSECMTGDTFHSLQCDCGEQLENALKKINESGNGVLIYLRQEGRGIGLFEKIKSYQLQNKGYDTFEANLMLGHRPDERTYEKAKMALADLKVRNIKLLTNNPSKVSEIAKLGIKVVERVPLIMKSNKHNKKYFASKRDKFKHFFNDEVSYYFYQFHAENAEQVELIGNFFKNKKRDPLLKICVGVSANNDIFNDPDRLANIESIFHACDFYEGFVPILHFSFRNSIDQIKELKLIKKELPFVKYIQTNDIKSSEVEVIKLSCKLFLADIPLSDSNFDLVHDEIFRKIIKKHKAFILLDNSKGTGVRESKESLMKKINILLEYGLNDIAIFGGFGPDDLDTYFELRRYFKINFSIDAETKLKTDGEIDIEKTKLYLSQLIRFDDPKESGIEQTRTFLQQNKSTKWQNAVVEGKEFMIHPAVFNSGHFASTAWFASAVKEQVVEQSDFCEIGCGAGVETCLVALANTKMNIVATDINPFASENAKFNAEKLGVGNRIEITTGDVLDGVSIGRKFDSIFWALPFGFLDPGTDVTMEEMQVFDPGYKAIRKFFNTAKKFLKPGGQLLIGFSSDLGNQELLEELAEEAGLEISIVAEKEIQEKETLRFELLKGEYKK